MTAIEYGDEMIVVDAGLTFPGDDLPGVDLVVPDISYLVANKSKSKRLFSLTDTKTTLGDFLMFSTKSMRHSMAHDSHLDLLKTK